MKISFIVPTLNRPTLGRTLASIQLRDGDEILVGCNHDSPRGDAERDRLIPKATGDYLMFIDDDDVYAHDCFPYIWQALDERPGPLHVFRMTSDRDGLLWGSQELRSGNVGTPMVAVPNLENMPKWTADDTTFSDCVFFQRVQALVQAQPVWHEREIVRVRP